MLPPAFCQVVMPRVQLATRLSIQPGVLAPGRDPLGGWGAAGRMGTPSQVGVLLAHLRRGARRPGKLQESQRLPGERKARDECAAGAVPRPGPWLRGRAPTWYFGGFPCRANPGLHPARYHRTCGRQRPLSPGHWLLPTLAGMGTRLGYAGDEGYFLPVETPRPPGTPTPGTPPMPAPGGIGKRSVLV